MKIKNPFKIKMLILAMTLLTLTFATGFVWYSHGDAVLEVSNKMYMVSHTEYRYGETGQIVVRLINSAGAAIPATCNTTILYPNKTLFVNNQVMTNTTAISGDHYYNFTTPTGPEGIYEYIAVCTYDPNKVQTATNSFHLSSAFNTVLADLSALNTTVNAVNLSLTTSINGVQSQLNSNVTSLIDQMNANTTAVLAAIAAINTTSSVNLTPVLDNQVVMMAYLAQINSTTESTYTYMTTTLATNVNSILSAIGVMNATVNRIETNTQNINSTVNQILQNQNDQVFMSVYSG